MSSSPVRVVVAGAAGRMGRMLLSLAAADRDLRVVGAVEAPGHAAIGSDVGTLVGSTSGGVLVSADVAKALADADVIIDFTSPEASLAHLRAAAAAGCAAVVGTTGFDPGQQQALLELTARVACVQASNMSAAVTVLTEVVEQVARRLGASFDIEIVEAHHRQKKDAPSGTAWMLARAAANGREARAEDWAVHGRQGITGPRRSQEMGVLALRGGDVVGDHTVYFFGQGERLELTHRAQSREAFASGALRAAHWVAGRPAGRYDMRHVLFGG